MKKILLSLLLGAIAQAAWSQAAPAPVYVDPELTHPAYQTVKIVIPMTSNDPKVWMFKMGNAGNAFDAVERFGGKADIKVVVYGGGMLLLKETSGPAADAVNRLRARGAQFLVCNNTLKGMDLDYHTLNAVPARDIVPSGFLEVGWLQQAQGYAVDPMN